MPAHLYPAVVLRKPLRSNVPQPGLEPGTARFEVQILGEGQDDDFLVAHGTNNALLTELN